MRAVDVVSLARFVYRRTRTTTSGFKRLRIDMSLYKRCLRVSWYACLLYLVILRFQPLLISVRNDVIHPMKAQN